MDETPRFPRDPLHIDDGTVDRLLDGLPVDDAPPSYRGVAELLSTVRAVPTSFDGDPERWTARFGAPSPVTVAEPLPQQKARQTKPTRRLRVTGAVLVGSATLFMGLGVAGALPGPAQGVAADVLATVGVHAPNPDAPADVDVQPASATDAGGSSGSGAPGAGAAGNGSTGAGSNAGTDKGATASSGSSDAKSQTAQHDPSAPSDSTTSGDTPDSDNGNSGNSESGNPATGNNGNDNSNSNGNGANNGNAYAGDGNAGQGQPNRP